MGASSDEPSASSTVASSARLRPSPRAGAVWPSPRGSCVIAPRAALPLARSTDAPREHHCSLHRVAGSADGDDGTGWRRPRGLTDSTARTARRPPLGDAPRSVVPAAKDQLDAGALEAEVL